MEQAKAQRLSWRQYCKDGKDGVQRTNRNATDIAERKAAGCSQGDEDSSKACGSGAHIG